MVYAIPYILLLGFYGVMAWLYKSASAQKARYLNITICMTVTLVFWGFRGFVFFDWMAYYPTFKFLVDDSSITTINLLSTEPGFQILMYCCKSLFNNYSFFVFVCTFINVVLLTRFMLRNIENIPFGLLIITSIVGITLFTDLMRNAISVFVFINAIEYLQKRKPIQYFGLCLIATMFHYSSLLFFPLYFFAHKRIRKWVFALILYVGAIVFALHVPLFITFIDVVVELISPEIEQAIHFYITEVADNAPGMNFVFFERIITGTLVICYMDKLRTIRDDANVYINCLLLFISMNFYMHEFVTMSIRLSMLFACGYWVVWGDLIKCFYYDANRKLYVFFITAYCFLRILGHTQNILAHYDNILFDSETFQERKSMFNKNYKGD